ncbi:MAG: rRNA cytosine-C5-methylase [Rikenellaceae bacterium]|nr:rRNA cytosine-C5-methylase [Rikenellaceae bacterium]MCL2692175.1 rRNA cytosine-C5-methylase [Rikenellaceae bacterium]
MNFPEEFTASITASLGAEEAQRLFAALDSSPPVSARLNPLKLSALPNGASRRAAWCDEGYYLDRRPRFALDPLWHAGAYYVQEASSMFIARIVRAVMDDLRIAGRGLRILDMCAAPGGKTTLLASLTGEDGLVVANETIRQRTAALVDNAVRWGTGNVVVTNNDPSHFQRLSGFFDVVLVDAPCSGEGMFRKNPEARAEWSTANVRLCAQRQRRILSDAWNALRPDGILIYSTCTFNRTENEENVEWMAREHGGEGIPTEAFLTNPTTTDCLSESHPPHSDSHAEDYGIVRGAIETSGRYDIPTFRFYPHRIAGEGFFAAVMRKPDAGDTARAANPKVSPQRRSVFAELPKSAPAELSRWVAEPNVMHFAQVGDSVYGYRSTTVRDVRAVAESLTAIYSGIGMGQLFHGKLRPAHSLALFGGLALDAAPQAALTLADALDYLRKNDISPELFAEGLNLVTYDGLPLGWLKRIGDRINNMYPKELRIATL